MWSSLTDELVRKLPAMITLSIEFCAFGFAARKKRSFSVLKNVPQEMALVTPTISKGIVKSYPVRSRTPRS